MRNSRTAQAGTRHWAKRRGEMGLHFTGALGPGERWSLSTAIREMARACHLLGREVTVGGEATAGWPSTSVRHLLGECVQPRCAVIWGGSWNQGYAREARDGTPVVAFDIHDGGHGLSTDAIQNHNAFIDLLCIPTQLGLDQFRAAGYTGAAAVVPLGVDVNLYHPRPRDNALLATAETFGRPQIGPETFVFMVAGHMQPRKGLGTVLDAFAGEFGPDEAVALLIKNVADSSWGQPCKLTAEAAAKGSRVALVEKDLLSFEYARLMASVDCVVSAHRREGFGLIPLEALASGTPVVSANCEGPATYLTPECAYLVEPMGWEPWPQGRKGLGLEWACLDPQTLGTAMRAAYEASPREREERRAAGFEVARAFTWANTARELVGAIEEHVGPVRRSRKTLGGRQDARCGLGILVPCRNSQEDLDRLIASFERTEWPGEKLVFAFDDASDEPIKSSWPGGCIRSNCWVGEMAARDALLRRQDLPEFLFMTDADVEFTDPRWAVTLADGLPPQGGLPMIVRHPLSLLPDGTIYSASGNYRKDGAQWHPWLVGMAKRPSELSLKQGEIPHAPGMGWFCRRDEIQAAWTWVGGYFPTMCGDTDMALWCRMHGMRFEFVPGAVVTHHQGSFTRKQTDVSAQQARVAAHNAAFLRQWGEMVEDDVARGW